MKPVYLCGRGLASALGLNLVQSLASLRKGGVPAASCFLPGIMDGHFPYHAIPYQLNDLGFTFEVQLQKRFADNGL